MTRRERREAETDSGKTQIRLECIRDSHPNWPAQVDLVRRRLLAIAEEIGEVDSLVETARHSDAAAYQLVCVQFLTTSHRVWRGWVIYRRLRGYSERLINAHIVDLPSVTRVAYEIPETLAVGAIIQQTVERGHTVILRPCVSGKPVLVIRTAVVDMDSGELAVSEERSPNASLTMVDLRQFAEAEVLDW